MTVRLLAVFTCVLIASLAACGEEDPIYVAPGSGTGQDVGTQADTGGTADVATGTDTGVAEDASTGTDVSTEDAAEVGLSELISALTQPCYDICLLGSGCSESDFSDLGVCEDDCDSEAGYILGNAADDDATRTCLAALLATEQCVVALDCGDFATWYNTFEGTYPCSAEDAAEEAACAELQWYQDF